MKNAPGILLLAASVATLGLPGSVFAQRADGTSFGGAVGFSSGSGLQLRTVVAHDPIGTAASLESAADFGFWFVELALGGEVAVGVESDLFPETLPERVTLEATYPNPATTATRVRFGVPADGRVRLVVFDALGRVVRHVVDERKPAGWHLADVPTRDLPSGTYFIRLESEGRDLVRPVVVLR